MRFIAVALVLLTACGQGDAQTTPPVASGKMQHYEVRADRLPKAYHTSSAGNPPRVISRPANAKLILPPKFKVSLWAADFDDPRNMVLAPNGDVFVADSAGGKIHVLREN